MLTYGPIHIWVTNIIYHKHKIHETIGYCGFNPITWAKTNAAFEFPQVPRAHSEGHERRSYRPGSGQVGGLADESLGENDGF